MPDHITTRLIKMKWSAGDDKWHMTDAATDKFIQEFYDCEKISVSFPDLDKALITTYQVDIRWVTSSALTQ